VEVGRFREAVEYVQKAAKALYKAARDVFEHVKVTAQRLVELFVEAVTRVLAWIDEHKAYLFLMAAVAAGVIALGVALNLWGLVELEKLAYATSLTPFVAAGVQEYSREEVFNILRSAPDPYEKFRKIAEEAIDKNEKLPQPWESLRVLIMPNESEKEKLKYSKTYKELDKRKEKALFYAVLALEEAFGVYRSALGEYAEGLREAVEKREVGEEPFKRVMYVADLGRLAQLAEKEETAIGAALKILRERLNEYAVKYGLGDLLDVNEDTARRLAEAKQPELSEFSGVNFGVKALAALIAYREYALGRRGVFGKAAWYWLEVGRSARLLYYPPITAYLKAKGAKVERSAAVEELVAEAFRRLFLKPGTDHHRGFVEELVKGGRLALMLENKTKSSYVFRLFRLEEGGKLVELEGIKLSIKEVGAGIVYALELDARWRDFFRQELEAAVKAAGEVGDRLPVEDRLPYMVGWVNSDVAISEGLLEMTTSHLWQLAETKALFDWSYVTMHGVGLTLEGPKPQFLAHTSLEKLDEAIRKSAEDGWLKMLGIKAESWDGLKRWVVENWDVVVDAAVKRLGEEVRGELNALRDRLNDDKVAREVVAPALLLIQAERLGVGEATLRYFGAVISGAIGGDGYVSAAMRVVGLASGEREIALLWAATLAAYGIKSGVKRDWSALNVAASGGGAARLAGLYFLYGPPLLEGDDRLKNHKLVGAVELGAERLSVGWEGLRRTDKGRVAADLTISEGDITIKYNVYLRKSAIVLQFVSSDRGRVELAARLLKLAGISAEVKREGDRDVWRIEVTTDVLAAGRKELREAVRKVVEEALEKGWVDEKKARRWLEKLEGGLMLKVGWPKYYVGLNKGALDVRYRSTNPEGIEQEAQRLRNMGLEEGRHFTVKMPEGEGMGYVNILREGLERAAWLSKYGSGRQRELVAEFVEYLLQRAREAGEDVYRKAEGIVKEGKAGGSLTLKGFEKRVEVDGKEYVVRVLGGGAEFDGGRSGKKLLRIRITAEVDGVKREYAITYGRRRADNVARGFAVARADAPGGREADAERFSAVVEALTGKRPKVYRMKNGKIIMECGKEHLEGFMRYTELAEAIKKWLEETSRR
jgi:hypothetical protein